MISRKCVLILIMMLGIVYQTFGTTEDSYRNLLALNFPYDRGVVRRYDALNFVSFLEIILINV